MRSFLSAMFAALKSAMAFAWRRCARTGAWVLEQVASIGSTPAMPSPVAIDEAAPVIEDRYQAIKDAALSLAAGIDDEKLLARLSEDHFRWLSTLSRSALCKIGCARDQVLEQHLRGQRMISGVRAADRESVEAYRQAMRVRHDDEHEPDWEVGMPGMTPGMGV